MRTTPLRTPSAPGLSVLACRFRIHSHETSGLAGANADINAPTTTIAAIAAITTGRACIGTLLHLFSPLEIVEQLRIAVHGQARRVAGAAVVRAMPHLLRHEHDVALRRVEDRQVANLVVDRPLEDEPELG